MAKKWVSHVNFDIRNLFLVSPSCMIYLPRGNFAVFHSMTSSKRAQSPMQCRWTGLTKYQFFGKKYIFPFRKLLEVMEKVYQQEYLFIFASGLWYLATNTSGLGIFSHIFKLKIKGNQFLVSKKKCHTLTNWDFSGYWNFWGL